MPMETPLIAVDPLQLEGLSWPALFGNEQPVELEIGVGKAGFLLRRATAHPETNFLGIEWANEFYRFSLDRMRRWNTTNVRLLRTDASLFIRRNCPRNSISALHVYHPDPWPKRRHARRRLIQPPFVDAAVECLRVGGRWAVQTDHAEYFTIIRDLLLSHPKLRETTFDDPQFGVEASRLATNFEVKYLKEGRRIHQLAVARAQ